MVLANVSLNRYQLNAQTGASIKVLAFCTNIVMCWYVSKCLSSFSVYPHWTESTFKKSRRL